MRRGEPRGCELLVGRRGALDQAFVKFASVVSAVERSSAVRRPRGVGLHGDRG